MKNKRTTIFKQLIINIVTPILLTLVILTFINYLRTKSNFEEWYENKQAMITNEISDIHEFQDLALDVLEEYLNRRMQFMSDSLVNYYFKNTDGIENADLMKIRERIGMDSFLEDIYIIDKQGIVVNTTFLTDTNLNLFDFGEEHKKYLLDIFDKPEFISERITIESKTRRLKKYSYQATRDGKYIVELGVYTKKADRIVEFIQKKFDEFSNKEGYQVFVDIFIGSDQPFSLYRKETVLKHPEMIRQVFIDMKTEVVYENEDSKDIYYSYIYMPRKNSDLYKGSVIMIKADRTDEKLILKKELLRSLLIFSVTILLIVILIYFRTRSITNPVKMLLQNVNRITDGHLSERAAVVGNNEITVLSEKFNIMIGELESYTNELEDKVRERTAEVVRQKEEIQKQHALITDSIHYAKRIQTAVLPGDETFSRLFRDYFIFFRPKDIVSGDFYFLLKVNKTIVFSAVDCTGHGVPGAFMSMLGTAFLNEIVRRQEVMHANQVLNILREKIKSSLKQKGGRHETKDGMDMALCAIDTETNELQYAGAYNPLLIIRNNEMIEFKGDRMPIGIHIKEKDTFTNHVVQLDKDDMIYIYSDGFSDQVGGEEKEKFRSDNFKRLLLEINQESLDKQRSRLELEFDNWKNNYKQIDDVMVLGVRI